MNFDQECCVLPQPLSVRPAHIEVYAVAYVLVLV